MSNQSAFPPPPSAIDPTPEEDLNAAVEKLAANKGKWAALPIPDRIRMLESLNRGLLSVAKEWAELGTAARGFWPSDVEAGEEWINGPTICIRNVRILIDALRDIERHGVPQLPAKNIRQRKSGRTVAEVMPYGMWDRLAQTFYRVEVWMEDGVTPQNLSDHQAKAYREPDHEGKVALVLGAGNQSSIPVMDALYKFFGENEVVLLKMNPVNEYLGPIFRQAFSQFVDEGYFEVVYGGAKEGSLLCHHEDVDTVHITGSDQTHDAIVWGPKKGRDTRKKKGEKVLSKPISSELGNVTPIIVAPGTWTQKQLKFQARNVAAMVSNNASFNCIAGKLLVLAKGWPQRDDFIREVESVLSGMRPRKAYYPGAKERWQRFVDTHPQAKILGETGDEVVPWTFIPDHDPNDTENIAFKVEPFCGVLHHVDIDATDAAEFLPKAVEFCNETVWGTLAVALLIDPKTQKDPSVNPHYEAALDDLRYGTIGVNHWPGVNYGLVTSTWGAYPGHSLEDIQSGRGVVHNTYMFDKPLKSVLYGPFMPPIHPIWFWDHPNLHKLGPNLMRFEAAPSMMRLMKVVRYAI